MNYKKDSMKQEKKVAWEIGGRTVVASGAFDEKGDVRNDKFLIECKRTQKDYYILTADTWNKIRSEAYKVGKCPVMSIDIKDVWGNPRRIAILRRDDFDYFNARANFPLCSIKERKEFNRQTRVRYGHICSALYSEELGGQEEICIIGWSDFLEIIEEDKKK